MKIIPASSLFNPKSKGYVENHIFPDLTFQLDLETKSPECLIYIKRGGADTVEGLNEDLYLVSTLAKNAIVFLDGTIPENIVYYPNVLYLISGFSSNNFINIMPIPCYYTHAAVNYMDSYYGKEDFFDFKKEKLYLCSFVGAFNTYPPRRRLKHLSEKYYVEEVNYWVLSQDDRNKASDKYKEILLNSKFSLCPRGGNNSSIRFPESILYGAVPILIDDFSCPFKQNLNSIPRISFDDLRFINSELSFNINLENVKADLLGFMSEFLLVDFHNPEYYKKARQEYFSGAFVFPSWLSIKRYYDNFFIPSLK